MKHAHPFYAPWTGEWFLHLPHVLGDQPGRLAAPIPHLVAWLPVPWQDHEEPINEAKREVAERYLSLALATHTLHHTAEQMEDLVQQLTRFCRRNVKAPAATLFGCCSVNARYLLNLCQGHPPDGTWMGLLDEEGLSLPLLVVRSSRLISVLSPLQSHSPAYDWEEGEQMSWLP